MRRSAIGILAHVDAGKTTLSEAMLYCAGAIRTLGRVDHGDAFLDNFALERQRGITIFSKQAVFDLPDMRVTLLDTPGHVDFSAETERTLDVLDCAVLVISAPAGVQSHTLTLWKLLREREIPTLIFVNKMDLPGADREEALMNLRSRLGDGVFDCEKPDAESLALCDEALLDELLETGGLSQQALTAAAGRAKIFPCWFGAALRLDGVEKLLEGIRAYAPSKPEGGEFGARVFKITRDAQGARLTHLKLCSGALHVRDTVSGDGWQEKITSIRVYSGAKYAAVDEAVSGDVVAVTGLSVTRPGLGLGTESGGRAPVLEPALSCRVLLPEGRDAHTAFLQLRQLAEEEPELQPEWDERRGQVSVRLMGPVQLEVLANIISERFGYEAGFGAPEVLYRETISTTVEGVGHYEPLRHYAEVHLVLSPAQRGEGIVLETRCPEDVLERNWQRLILTHLAEKTHIGVLTGAPLTDVRITLVSGKAHPKHTEGGDFRQATYRAVRQGLMSAKSVLLEPWCDFRLELPAQHIGRALADLQRLGAELQPPQTTQSGAALTGSAPISALREYPAEISAYTHGLGVFSTVFSGYAPCREQQQAVAAIGYEPEADLDNTPDSVFCGHGAGYTVKWYDVPRQMHLPSALVAAPKSEEMRERARSYVEMAATDKELMAIFERTYGPIKRDIRAIQPRTKLPAAAPKAANRPKTKTDDGPEFVLVDGYNIIFAWEDMTKLAEQSLEAARLRLTERLINYQGFRRCYVILVFDAYKVKGNPGSVERHGGVTVVFTKEAQTADMYIEKATHDLSRRHRVRVATSDGMEQLIILGNGALRVPARAFEAELREVEEAIRAFVHEQA